MVEEQEVESFIDRLKKENQMLRGKIKEYKSLEEDLLADHVYKKAKKRLVSTITIAGTLITILGIIGVKSIVDYTKDIVTKKLESVSEVQINKFFEKESNRQISILIKEKKIELDQFLVGLKKQGQYEILEAPFKPLSGFEKSSTSVVIKRRQIDLTSSMTPVRQQGREGSVVGFAVAAALEYQIYKKLNQQVIISPRYIYYYAKLEMGVDPKTDSGAFIRDAVKVIQSKGAVSEDVWPYKPQDYKSTPPKEIETAHYYKITESHQLNNLEEIKSALQKYGPVVAGFTVYESAHDKSVRKTGIIPDPAPDENRYGGGAICIVGYDDDNERIKFKNSWGSDWGEGGYGYMSYNFANKFLSDIWTFTM